MPISAPRPAFRTVCVRTCDGAYFPVSFATFRRAFQDDEKTCKALCPATEATLFTYRNPGEDINQAVSISGQPYSSLPNAFNFRTEFNPSCACKAAGQTWSDALKSVEDKAAAEQQGDIIVTEESAKRMQQRAQSRRRTAAQEGRRRLGWHRRRIASGSPGARGRMPPHARRQDSRSAPSARPSSRRSNEGAQSLLRRHHQTLYRESLTERCVISARM